jgi:hypothetical protein
MFERPLTRSEVELIVRAQAFVRQKHARTEQHDFAHVMSVVRYALQIARAIPDEVDPFVLVCGALFHDIGWIGTVTGVVHGLRGATVVREYLSAAGVRADIIDRIVQVVVRHTVSSGLAPERPEEKVVHDADGLDALGLIGMLRGLIGKEGSIEEVIRGDIQLGVKTFERLYYPESRRLGEALQRETEEVIARFRAALDRRLRQIDELPLPVANTIEG